MKISLLLSVLAVVQALSSPVHAQVEGSANDAAADAMEQALSGDDAAPEQPAGDGGNLRPALSKKPSSGNLHQADDKDGAGIPHLTTNDFLSAVADAETPVLVQFDAVWCPFCKALQPHLDKLMRQKTGSLAVYKVDIDHEPDLQRSYEVASLPTLIMFNDGRVVGRSDGSLSEKELSDWVEAVEDDIKKSAAAKKRGRL